jgi:PAS domain S-box-containing protein
MLKRYLALPIRTHFLVLICILTVLFLSINLYIVFREEQEALEDAQNDCLKFVNSVAREQQILVTGIRQLASTIALLPETTLRDSHKIKTILGKLLSENPQYTNITISDETGKVWVSALPFKKSLSVAQHKYFKDTMRTGMFSSGDYSIGRMTQKPILIFGYPLKDTSGRVKGVIGIGIDLVNIRLAFEKLNFPTGSSFSLLDYQGIILYRHLQDKLSKRLIGKRDVQQKIFTPLQAGPEEGSFIAVGNDDNERLFAYQKLKLPHEAQPYLYIRASVPRLTVTKVFFQKKTGTLSTIVLLSIAGILWAWFIGKRIIVDRVAALEQASHQLASTPGPVKVSQIVQGSDLVEFAKAMDRMSETIADKEATLHTLLEAVTESLFMIDAKGTVITLNTTTAARFGKTREQMIGQNIFDLLPANLVNSRKLRLEEVLQTNHIVRFEDIRDGRWIETILYPLGLMHEPSADRVVIFARDITEQKQAEEALISSQAELKAVYDHAPVMMCVLDETRHIIYANQSFSEFTEALPETFTGKSTGSALGCINALTDPKGCGFGSDCENCTLRLAMEDTLESGAEHRNIERETTLVQGDNKKDVVLLGSTAIIRAQDKNLLLLCLHDITELKKAEQQLRQTEEQFRSLMESAPEGIFVQSGGRFVYLNPAMLDLLGASHPDELIGQELMDRIALEYHEAVHERIRTQLETGKPAPPMEQEYIRLDGSQVAVETTAVAVNYKGKKAHMVFVRDITGRKATEKALQKNTELMNAIRIAQASFIEAGDPYSAFETLLGSLVSLTKSEFGFIDEVLFDEKGVPYKLNLAISDISWNPEVKTLYEKLKGRQLEFRNLQNLAGVAALTGQPVIANDAANDPRSGGLPPGHPPIKTFLGLPLFFGGNLVGVAGIANRQDGYDDRIIHFLGPYLSSCSSIIHAIRLKEKEKEILSLLQERESHLQTLINTIPDLVWLKDTEGVYLKCNRRFEKFFGAKEEDIVGKTDFDFMDKDLADLFRSRDRAAVTAGRPTMNEEEITFAEDGHKEFLETIKTPIFGNNGQLIGVLGVGRDISQRKQAESALQESEEKFAKAFTRFPFLMTISSIEDGTYLVVNDKFLEVSGFAKEEAIGKTSVQLGWINVKDRDFLIHELKEKGSLYGIELKLRTKDKREVLCLYYGEIINISGQPRLLGIAQDITQIRDIEERLKRSEKMEALGTLAGGVAHDLNNVLGVVIAFAEILTDKIDTSSPLRTYVKHIMDNSERAAAIVDDLLTMARRGVQKEMVFNLNAVIKEYLDSPEYQRLLALHPHTQTEAHLDPELLNIQGSPVHLGKTIMNLVNNGLEAMSQDGRLTVTTQNQYLDHPVQGYDEVKEGDYVVLSITDTGEGIPASDLKRIFEPFYTKKAMGKSGTGLGLSVVWGAVKDHKGYIDIESKVGRGSTFRLYFPVTRESLPESESAVPISSYMGNRELILIVDDVYGQRELATQMLMKLNYQVDSVDSGEEAVEYVKKKKPDLVVLDMIMNPGIDGLQTYSKILAINPDQKAIIVSGFAETEKVKLVQELGAGAFVKKPYMSQKLGIAVRQELNRSRKTAPPKNG